MKVNFVFILLYFIIYFLGIGDSQSPIPNPQSPIPNPHFYMVRKIKKIY